MFFQLPQPALEIRSKSASLKVDTPLFSSYSEKNLQIVSTSFKNKKIMDFILFFDKKFFQIKVSDLKNRMISILLKLVLVI